MFQALQEAQQASEADVTKSAEVESVIRTESPVKGKKTPPAKTV